MQDGLAASDNGIARFSRTGTSLDCNAGRSVNRVMVQNRKEFWWFLPLRSDFKTWNQDEIARMDFEGKGFGRNGKAPTGECDRGFVKRLMVGDVMQGIWSRHSKQTIFPCPYRTSGTSRKSRSQGSRLCRFQFSWRETSPRSERFSFPREEP